MCSRNRDVSPSGLNTPYTSWYEPENAYNIVRDWNMLQGVTQQTDEYNKIRRDINSRLISIENSSRDKVIGIGIESFLLVPNIHFNPDSSNKIPGIPEVKYKFILRPGENRAIGINTPDGPAQYIYIIDPITKRIIGVPTVLATNANQFVLRDGVNMWFVDKFRSSRVIRA